MHPHELSYIQELLRFLTLSFLFYFDEPVVTELLKPYLNIEDSEEFEQSTIWNLVDALKLCLSSKQIEIRKNALRCLQIILLTDQVKTCIDMTSGMPYFSVPTYMTNTCEFLFPKKFYRFALVSKVALLNPEEKSFVQIQTKAKEDERKRGKFDTGVTSDIDEDKVNKNWFDVIERLSPSDTFDFLSSNVFMKLVVNKSSIIKDASSKENMTLIKDSFEIVPSDLASAKTLSSFYLNLKVLLKDLKFKIATLGTGAQFSKGLKSFYLLVISKMREINLPYHYIYSQIIDVGIENRQTCHMGPLKLTEYA